MLFQRGFANASASPKSRERSLNVVGWFETPQYHPGDNRFDMVSVKLGQGSPTQEKRTIAPRCSSTVFKWQLFNSRSPIGPYNPAHQCG